VLNLTTETESETRVECDVCDAAEFICGEVNERTLEGEGWYLGPTQTLCPDHSEQEND
jgi:hypothetical protein